MINHFFIFLPASFLATDHPIAKACPHENGGAKDTKEKLYKRSIKGLIT
jgi:hypothetical protein